MSGKITISGNLKVNFTPSPNSFNPNPHIRLLQRGEVIEADGTTDEAIIELQMKISDKIAEAITAWDEGQKQDAEYHRKLVEQYA